MQLHLDQRGKSCIRENENVVLQGQVHERNVFESAKSDRKMRGTCKVQVESGIDAWKLLLSFSFRFQRERLTIRTVVVDSFAFPIYLLRAVCVSNRAPSACLHFFTVYFIFILWEDSEQVSHIFVTSYHISECPNPQPRSLRSFCQIKERRRQGMPRGWDHGAGSVYRKRR